MHEGIAKVPTEKFKYIRKNWSILQKRQERIVNKKMWQIEINQIVNINLTKLIIT